MAAPVCPCEKTYAAFAAMLGAAAIDAIEPLSGGAAGAALFRVEGNAALACPGRGEREPVAQSPALAARLFAHVQRSGLFAAGLLDRHAARLDQLRAGLSWDDAGLVASHNDVHRHNILFDGHHVPARDAI